MMNSITANLALLAKYNNVKPKVSPQVSPLYQYIKPHNSSGGYQLAATLCKGYKRVVARGKTPEACYEAAVRFIHKYNVPYDY